VSGRTGVTLSREHAKRALTHKQSSQAALPRAGSAYVIPDTFVSLSRSLDAETYVKRVNAYDAYLAGLADIRYDFKRNRAVFLVKQGNKVVDATGRSLNGRAPKWYRYNGSKYPFICGSKPFAILVEDCASACAVSKCAVGVALLGTNLLPEHIKTLTKFQRVYVALDKDATDKAVDMVRVLNNHVPTKLMILRTDLKNMDRDERDDFIRSYINR
jgi:DNA primase